MALTLQQLQTRAEAVAKEADEMVKAAEADNDGAGRNLTKEEKTRFDQLLQERTDLQERIKRQQMIADLEKPLGRKSDPLPPGQPELERRISAKPKRYAGTLKAFRGANGAEEAYRSFQWLKATVLRRFNGGDEKAIQYCRDHGIETRVMTGSSGTAGGFLVPEEFESAVINLKEERGVFRRECRVLPMTSDTLSQPRRTGGVTVYYVGETTEITASDASWDNIKLVARKPAVLCRISSDLNEDSAIQIMDFLAEEIGYGFANAEDQAGFNGDGTSTYGGIFGLIPKISDGNHAGSVYNPGSGDLAFSDVALGDLESMVGQLPQYAASNAKWYISRAGFYASMQRLLDAAGGNTIDTLAQNNNQAGGRPIQCLGYPVVVSQVLNSTLTDQASTALFAFGDLRQTAVYGDRRGMTMKMSEDRYLEYDQLALQATMRYDIVVHEAGDGTNAGSTIVYVTPGS